MVQWQDPAVKARVGVIYMNVAHLLLGIYAWEYARSFEIEYAIIRGRLNFRWALIPYVVGRLALFVALLLLILEENLPPASFSCQPIILSIAAFSSISQACSTANFMIRTWLIWKDSRLVHILLLLLSFGHWTIIILGDAHIKAIRSHGVCTIRLAQPKMTEGLFTYGMCYDFIVFVLSFVKLSRQPSKHRLIERLRSQGVFYFAVAVVANIPPTVFVFLGPAVMAALFGNIVMTASTIVSCRAVKSLLEPRDLQLGLDESTESGVMLTTDISTTQYTSTNV